MWTLIKKGKKVEKENLAQHVLVDLIKGLPPLNISKSFKTPKIWPYNPIAIELGKMQHNKQFIVTSKHPSQFLKLWICKLKRY
jgi:hypothetical protein